MDSSYNEKSVYDQLNTVDIDRQSDIAKQKIEEERAQRRREEEMYSSGTFNKFFKNLATDAKRLKGEILIAVLFMLFAINLIFVVISNCIDFVTLTTHTSLKYNTILIAAECVVPFFIWMKSTDFGMYNYHRVKHTLFSFCVINWILLTFSLFRLSAMKVMSTIFFAIPVSGTVPIAAVVVGYYVATGGIILFPILALWMRAYKSINEKLMYRQIVRFRISKIMPEMPWERKYNYDLCIVRHLNTGKMHRIYEDDRRLHTKGVGSTGGGKTATILTTSFEADLRQKVKNIDIQKKKVEKLLKANKVYMTRDFDDIDFNIDNFKPLPDLSKSQYKKVEDKLKYLKYTVKNAGITVMCPNEAFCDELYEKAQAKNLKVNRVDPCVNPDGSFKDDFIGFSPIYVPIIKGEKEDSYLFRVFTAAKLYADVNQAIFELSGKGDPYFTGLNKNISVTAAVTVIIAYPLIHPGHYATIEHVQAIVNDFKQIAPYRKALIEKYGRPNELGVIVQTPGKTNVGPNLQFIIDRIDRDFLGDNATKINEQATGLRNIIDESLMNPRIRNILCAEHTLNIDQALEKGELTLVNFEISLGSDATGFGMFFMLSFIQSILRRPGTLKTRLPHFFAIDEMPTLLHPRLETATTLARQYNVSLMMFLQSLDQYSKNDTTRYMKSVLTGNCAHQIVFGRASIEDMEFYSKLSGYKWEIEDTESVRETALSDENTAQAYTHTSKLEQNERISTDDLRYREFLECTVISTKNSTPLEPFLGKTNFLPRGYDPHMSRYTVNWHRYYNGIHVDAEEERAEEESSILAFNETGAKTSVDESIKAEPEDKFADIDRTAPLFLSGFSNTPATITEGTSNNSTDSSEEQSETLSQAEASEEDCEEEECETGYEEDMTDDITQINEVAETSPDDYYEDDGFDADELLIKAPRKKR